jgi:hypothetical protein
MYDLGVATALAVVESVRQCGACGYILDTTEFPASASGRGRVLGVCTRCATRRAAEQAVQAALEQAALRVPEIEVSDVVAGQAQWLLEAGRVCVVGPGVALVAGRHHFYKVRAQASGVFCSCEARSDYCSHVIASMCAFEEHRAELLGA